MKYADKDMQKAFYLAYGKTGSARTARNVVDEVSIAATGGELRTLCERYKDAGLVLRIKEMIGNSTRFDD
jgi:hypothetical protein